VFKAVFPTVNQGLLQMEVQYFSSKFGTMTVIQQVNEEKYVHMMAFESYIFIMFVKDCLAKTMNQWLEKSFNIDEQAVRLYNDILDESEGYEIKRAENV
jgi:hypothetical protein